MYFLNINKPKGISSFDVIRNLRKILKIKQIGHSGTLDPLASGVLQIGVGKATKLLDFLPSQKQYIADLVFGYKTATFDSQGEREFIKKPDFSKNKFEAILNTFLGEINQIPPKYSAIKINGQKLCDAARKNPDFEISIPSRKIEIKSIEILEFDGKTAKIKVDCSKGTYIRSLANDIGEKLGCGAFLGDLVRTCAGEFRIENSDELNCEKFNKIDPLKALNFENRELNSYEFSKIMNGNFIANNCEKKSGIILLTKDNKLVSIANLADNYIKPKKILWEIK